MSFLPTHSASARLIAFAILLAVLPIAALGWVGWLLLEQDRILDAQRQRERLENAANALADTLMTAQGTSSQVLPPDSVRMLVGPRGVIRREGVALPYYPLAAPQTEAAPQMFAAAEVAEVQGQPATAVDEYRSLALSKDPAIRAGALMRLSRVLRNQGRMKEALAVYDELAGMGAAPVAGDPAELVARRQRIALLIGSGEVSAAENDRKALAIALAEGRYTLDRVTFDFYAENLPGLSVRHYELASAVEEWWPRWHMRPSGRATWTVGETAFALVWQPAPQGTLVTLGTADVNRPRAREAAEYRRNLLISGFGLMVLVVAAAGYFVFRAVHRELAVARLQSDFVAQVSHEFRTPLTAMRHLTDLLEEGTAPPGRLPKYYEALGKETRRLHAMVESLLDFGRMESGRRAYDMQRTNLSDLARQVAQEFSPLRIRLDVPTDGPHIRADREAVVLALRNLVDNAMKYSPDTTPVTLTVEEQRGTAGVSVEDRGAGISHEEQREILRKFVRGSAARAMNVKGTGLGLAAVARVVRAHGGRLEIRSQPGQGSRFTIWVPATEERA